MQGDWSSKEAALHRKSQHNVFEQSLLLWKGTLTRSSFPTLFSVLKTNISNEYSNQMTDSERVKVILGVVGQGMKKPKDIE
jgi:hypothetical protein